MIRNWLPILLLSVAFGCGGRKGTPTSVASLLNLKITLNLGSGYASTSAPTPREDVEVDLDFAGSGQMLGDGCPIVQGSATFSGIPLKQIMSGGAEECSINDSSECDHLCLGVSWYGDVSSLWGTPLDSAEVVMTDNGGSVQATTSNPFWPAEVTVANVVEGQVITGSAVFEVNIQPAPPLGADALGLAHIADATGDGVSFDIIQGGANVGIPGNDITVGLPGTWAVSLVHTRNSLVSGPMELWVNYDKTVGYVACQTGAFCSGSTTMQWKRLGVVYAP
jgi:hypothetical protein